jgi:ABC-type polysaccharide transport system permease subunit
MEPLLLITNLKSDDGRLAVAVTKVYLMRWRIEEFYRFKKQQFGFEDFRVRSLKSIRNLDLLLTIAIGYIGLMSEKSDERAITAEIIAISKRIYDTPKFVFYAIADGLFFVLFKCKQGIADMLLKQPKSAQMSFLPDIGFAWS